MDRALYSSATRRDWQAVFSFCENKGKTQWYVLEDESGEDTLVAVRRSYEALEKMGKV